MGASQIEIRWASWEHEIWSSRQFYHVRFVTRRRLWFRQLLGSSGFLASTQAVYQKLAASCAAPARSCSVTG
jgi:hypothetical protein